MPIYQCLKCGKQIRLSIKPGQCEKCGYQQFKFNRQSEVVLVSFDSGRLSGPLKSPPTSGIFLAPADDTPSTSKVYSRPKRNRKKNFREKILASFDISYFYKFLVILFSGSLGLGSYWLWRGQFNTIEFKKLVLKESFNNPKKWLLTDNAVISNGVLQHRKYRRNPYGASIWTGKMFQDIDFTGDVIKTDGSDDVSYGLMASLQEKKAKKFYYLLIDGRGHFRMGKYDRQRWVDRIGRQKHGAINSGNSRNRLRIVINNGLIIGFINGRVVGSFRDGELKRGRVALVSTRNGTKTANVHFDNVVIKEKNKIATGK